MYVNINKYIQYDKNPCIIVFMDGIQYVTITEKVKTCWYYTTKKCKHSLFNAVKLLNH